MPRQHNVQKVMDGILAAYRDAGTREPTSTEIIAASGVSSATYYRVVESSTEANATLTAAKSAWTANVDTPEPSDPIAAHPHAVVKELKGVIAYLLSVIEDKDAQIERLTLHQKQSGNVVPMRRGAASPRNTEQRD